MTSKDLAGIAIEMVEVPASTLERLRKEVRVVDEQVVCEGEPHTEEQVDELNRLYDAAADLVDMADFFNGPTCKADFS